MQFDMKHRRFIPTASHDTIFLSLDNPKFTTLIIATEMISLQQTLFGQFDIDLARIIAFDLQLWFWHLFRFFTKGKNARLFSTSLESVISTWF